MIEGRRRVIRLKKMRKYEREKMIRKEEEHKKNRLQGGC